MPVLARPAEMKYVCNHTLLFLCGFWGYNSATCLLWKYFIVWALLPALFSLCLSLMAAMMVAEKCIILELISTSPWINDREQFFIRWFSIWRILQKMSIYVFATLKLSFCYWALRFNKYICLLDPSEIHVKKYSILWIFL